MDQIDSHNENEATWYVDFKVLLGDKNIPKAYAGFNIFRRITERLSNPLFTNTDGRLGYEFYFLVCSRGYAQNPDINLHTKEDTRRALIQDKFDQRAALSYLSGRIESLGESSADDFTRKVKDFLDTTDWDDETKGYAN